MQSIFEKNGCPGPIVSRVRQQTLESEPMRTGEQRKADKVYIRLPWLGPKSAAFRNRIHRATIKALPDCKAVCTFTTRRLFNTCKKDVLPAESLSNVIYFLTVHVSRVTLEGRHNALKNGSSSTFLRAWSKRLNLKRRNRRRRGRRRGRRKRRRRQQKIKAVPVQREGAKERT